MISLQPIQVQILTFFIWKYFKFPAFEPVLLMAKNLNFFFKIEKLCIRTLVFCSNDIMCNRWYQNKSILGWLEFHKLLYSILLSCNFIVYIFNQAMCHPNFLDDNDLIGKRRNVCFLSITYDNFLRWNTWKFNFHFADMISRSACD